MQKKESIADRVKYLRREIGKTQGEFGEILGLSDSQISRIENSLTPLTEQNILSICRAFGINRKWLETGVGEVYDDAGNRRAARGHQLIDEINLRLVRGPTQVPIKVIAELVGIDIEDFPTGRDRVVEFASEVIPQALDMIINIFREGDRMKVDALMALLYALTRKKTEQLVSQNIKDAKKRNALEYIEWARKAKEIHDFGAARTLFSTGINLLKEINQLGEHDTLIHNIYQECVALAIDDPLFKGILDPIIKIIKKFPGISLNDIYPALPAQDKEAINTVIRTAQASGLIKMIRAGDSYRLTMEIVDY